MYSGLIALAVPYPQHLERNPLVVRSNRPWAVTLEKLTCGAF